MKFKKHSIKGILLSTAAVIVIGGLVGGNALAADGTWIFLTGNSNWTTATSWQDSIIPGAAGTTTSTDIGNFNGTIAANRTVNVDANRNIAGLKIGANNTNFAYIFNGGATGTFVLSAGGSIELDSTATSGTHRDLVNASISLVGDATFINNASGANRSLRIQAVTGSATLGNVSTLTINGSNTSTSNLMNSPIGDGANGGKLTLTKSGAGTWAMSGTSIYTGNTTISQGTLALTGTGSINTSPNIIVGASTTFNVSGVTGYTLAANQTLSGSGTVIGATNVAGTLSPGNSPGTLSVGNQTWLDGGDYNWQMLDAIGTAGTGFDTIAMTGTLDLSNVGLTAGGFGINLWSLSSISPDVDGNAINFDNTLTQSWNLLTASGGITGFDAADFVINTGAANGTGGFSNNLGGGGAFSLGTSGNNLVLNFTAVPEPSVAALLGGLGLLALVRRRRN